MLGYLLMVTLGEESEVSLDEPVNQYMTPSPLFITSEMLVSEVVKFFNEKKIPSVFVVKDKIPVGFVHINQLTSTVWLN
jgi:arabinose-5-phosphate isomerase